MITISPSQMRSMGCRQKWQWQYRDGYRAIMPNHNLEFGSGIHAALEYYYTQVFGEDHSDLSQFFSNWMDLKIESINSKFDDEVEKFHDLKDLGVTMLDGYRKEYEGKEEAEFEVLATEKTLKRRLPLPIPGTDRMSKCWVIVRLDGIVRCLKTNKLFSLEHKTFKRFAPKEIENDQQFTAQMWVGQSYADSCGLDEPLAGVIYNGLRKQRPGPRVKVPLFERHKVYRNEHEVQAFLHRAYWQYRESKHWKIFAEPTTLGCSQCDFNEPCLEKMRGGDYQFLLNHNYTKRKDKKTRSPFSSSEKGKNEVKHGKSKSKT